MKGIEKVFTLKIVSLLVAILFFLNSTAYSVSTADITHLRKPLDFNLDIRERHSVIKRIKAFFTKKPSLVSVASEEPWNNCGRDLQDAIMAIRQLEKKYGKGCIVIYGGIPRKLLLNERIDKGVTKRGDADVDILVGTEKERSDEKDEILYEFERLLGLTEGSIFKGKAFVNKLAIEYLGYYNLGSRKIRPKKRFEQFINKIQISFNTMWMTSDLEVIDMHGGKEDLEKGIIRFVGSNPRKYVNHLTILRAIRFKHQFGFEYEENTKNLIENFFKNLKFYEEGKRWESWLKEACLYCDYIKAQEEQNYENLASYMKYKLKIIKKRYKHEPFIPFGFVLPRIYKDIEEKNISEDTITDFKTLLGYVEAKTEGTDVEVDLRAVAKSKGLRNDAFYIGGSIRNIITNAIDPAAAVQELKDIGFGKIMEASGINIDSVLQEWLDMRKSVDCTLQRLLPKGQSETYL
jgi:hypothetical protein